MTSSRPSGVAPAAIAGLTLALVLPSAPLFEKYLGAWSVPLYVAGTPLALLGALRLLPLLARQPRPVLGALTLLGLAGAATLFLVVYPKVNVHLPWKGADGDDALDQGVRALLRGGYPYEKPTYLGNPIAPGPGSMLLALPFVLLGGSAYQGLFWLPVALWLLARQCGSWAGGLWLCAVMGLLCPAFGNGLAAGVDQFPNSVAVLAGVLATLPPPALPSFSPRRVSALVFFGLTLATRASFAFLLPVWAAATYRQIGLRRTTVALAVVLGTVALLTLPFYLAHPESFGPLHTLRKVARVPGGAVAVSMANVALALLLAWGADGRASDALRRIFWVLLFPMGVLTVSEGVQGRGWAGAWWALLVVVFGLASHGVALVRGMLGGTPEDVPAPEPFR